MGKARRLLPVLAAVSLSAGVIIFVVGALWVAGSASGERAKFSSLEIAPRDADVFVAINTDPTSPQWLAVMDSLDTIKAKDPVRRAIDKALAEVNLDWEEDILPVAGDEGFFSVPDIAKASGDEGYVAAFRVRNAGKAGEVFDSLRARAESEGQEFKSEEYEGVTIHTVVEPDIDGDPSTESDCTVDEDGTIRCDGQAPIPEDPFWTCAEIGYDLSLEGRSIGEAPPECQPFFNCPAYWPSEEPVNTQDSDGDGTSDACEEADRIKREYEIGIQYAAPHQDCADVQDVSDPECGGAATLTTTSGAVAVFADVIAVGASGDDVKAVIDVVHGRAPSAAENERLSEFREAQSEEFLVWGSADMAPVWDMLEAAVPADSGTSSEPPPIDLTPLPLPGEPEAGFRVASFDADYTIDANGTLLIKETIAVDFGTEQKHGIFREIPARMSYDSANDAVLRVDNFVVNRNGAPESMQADLLGDIYEVRIGDTNVTISGPQTYEFEYTVAGAIRQSRSGEDPYYELRWHANGDRWPVALEKVAVTVNTPHGAIDTATCHGGEGEFGVDGYIRCKASFEGQTARFVPEGSIHPGAGLQFTIGVNGESGAPPLELVPSENPPYQEEDTPIAELPAEQFPFAFGSEEFMKELRGTYDRVGFSVSSTGDGFAVDVSVLHEPGFEPKYSIAPTKAFDSHFADSVPADTMFFFAGYDPYGQSWLPVREQLQDFEFPDGSTLADYLQQFSDETGLDLEKDILSLLTGEYAVAGDVRGFEQASPDFSVLAMVDVADAERARQSLDKLGDYLQRQNAVEINEEHGVQRWTVSGSSAEVIGVTVSGDAVIAGYPDSAVEDAVAGIDEPLSGTEDWKKTMGLLPGETTSVGFISVSRILDGVRRIEDAERSFEEATNGDLKLEDLAPIRSVGYATTVEDGGFGARVVVLIED